MQELDELPLKIQDLREHIQYLIDKKGDLLDTEIISASKKLDELLNQYEKLLHKE